MRLLFNLEAVQPIHSAKFHGGGSYGEVLFWAILKKFQEGLLEKKNFYCVYDSGKYLDSAIIQTCKDNGISLLDLNQQTPQEMIDQNKIDTFYTPLYSLAKKWDIQVKDFVFTWHGVRALEMQYSSAGVSFAKKFSQKLEALIRYRESWKKYFYKPKYQALANRMAAAVTSTTVSNANVATNPVTAKGAVAASTIGSATNSTTVKGTAANSVANQVRAITVSEHSKASIKSFFPELLNLDIPVFYSPMTEYEPVGFLPPEVSSKKYFLLTSGARWEKNNLRAAKAFDQLVDMYESQVVPFEFKMVITGATNTRAYLKHLRHKDRFVLLGYVENKELEYLHQNAYAFIFPSLNEGFGYPPVQSMRYGVPVAVSGTTSVPEICGDAAIFFDPYSVSEIKNRMVQLLDESIYNEFASRAKERYSIVRKRQVEDLDKAVRFILKI